MLVLVYYSTNAAGSGFVTTTIDDGANAQSGLILQFDDNDKAHIVYHNSNGNTLNYFIKCSVLGLPIP